MDFPIWPAHLSTAANFFVLPERIVGVEWIPFSALFAGCAALLLLGGAVGWWAGRSRSVATREVPRPLAVDPDSLRTVIAALPLPCWQMDADGRVAFANAEAEERLGIRSGLFGRISTSSGEKSDARELVGKAFERAQGHAVTSERIHYLHRGVQHEGIVVLVRLPNDEHSAEALAFVSDLPGAAVPEAPPTDSGCILTDFFEAAPIPAVAWDLSGGVRVWNAGAQLFFGYTAAEALGKKAAELIVPESEKSCYSNAWKEVVEKRQRVNVVLQSRTKSGAILRCEWSSFPIFDSHRRLLAVGSLVKGADESAGAHAGAEQDRNLESLGRLAAGIAHEFNNFLAPMVIDVERLAANASEPERVLAHVNSFRLAIAHARELTERTQLLDGNLPEARDWTSLNELVQSALTALRAGMDLRIGIDTTLAPGLPLLPVSRVAVIQILTQLIFNARDSLSGSFGGSRPPIDRPAIAVSTRRFEGINPSAPRRGIAAYQVITVRDNGPGLTPDAKAHAFEPFFAPYAPGSGLGLGLHLVWRLARSHEGWVTLQSEPGEGCELRVFIPELPLDHVPLPVNAVEIAADPTAPRKSGVLLVEDNLLVANALSGVLSDRGFDVYFAENGERAWSLFNQDRTRIDLVLSDLNLPGMSGRDLLRKLRQEKFSLPVIILSGHIAGVDATELLALGATSLLTKPVNPRELIDAVMRAAPPPK